MSGYSRVNIHAYTEAQLQDVAVVQGLFPGLPIICTEVNQMAPSFYAAKLASMGCRESYWFILSGDGAENKLYHLMGSGYYEDFKALAQGIGQPPPVPPTDGPVVKPDDEIEGGTMLKDQFPAEHAAWVAAGGDPEEAFKFYAMAQGLIPVNQDFLEAMADNLASHAKELAIGISKLPL